MTDEDDFFERVRRGDSSIGAPLLIGKCPKGCRLIRVWKRPTAWALLVDGGQVAATDWLDRTGAEVDGVPVTPDAVFERTVYPANLNRVRGSHRFMPLDFAEWPAANLAVVCKHRPAPAPAAVVVAAITEARATGKSGVSIRMPIGLAR